MAEEFDAKTEYGENQHAIVQHDAAPAGQSEDSAPTASGQGAIVQLHLRAQKQDWIRARHAASRQYCQECHRGKVYRQKDQATLVGFVGDSTSSKLHRV